MHRKLKPSYGRQGATATNSRDDSCTANGNQRERERIFSSKARKFKVREGTAKADSGGDARAVLGDDLLGGEDVACLLARWFLNTDFVNVFDTMVLTERKGNSQKRCNV